MTQRGRRNLRRTVGLSIGWVAGWSLTLLLLWAVWQSERLGILVKVLVSPLFVVATLIALAAAHDITSGRRMEPGCGEP